MQRTFIELGEKYVDSYLAGTLTEEMIAKFQSVREILCECYIALVKKKELIPIEVMPLKEKNELWDLCKNYCAALSMKERTRFVKAYAALSCLMEKRL